MEVELSSKANGGADSKAGSEEAEARPRFSRRLSARTVSASAPAQPSSSTLAQVAPRRVVSVATRSIRAPTHARSVSAQVSTASVPAVAPVDDTRTRAKHQPTPEVESDGPAHKRRRTSSIDAEEASRAVAQATEQSVNVEQADEEEIWTDLDKDDDGDPLMVSEYVVDIFEYMVELEVSTLPYFSRHVSHGSDFDRKSKRK